MNDTLIPEDRDAVYYPYIHVRSKTWLNGTLLCFPHLVRMVPSSYPVRDDPWLREYFDTAGRRQRPLLQTIDFWQPEVKSAQDMLAAKIREDATKPAFVDRFKLPATMQSGFGKDSFRISKDRLFGSDAGSDLYAVLDAHELVWEVSSGEYGVNPVLGEAIMATVAMALAERDGMDVVTPSGRVHDVLAARRAELVYNALVRGESVAAPPAQELIVRLASLVVIGAFDVAELSAEEIAKLHANGEDLARFRAELAKDVASIPAMKNHILREEHLRERAVAIVKKWQSDRLNFSKFAKSLYSPDALGVGESVAKDFLEGLLSAGGVAAAGTAAAGAVSFAAVAPGLIVGVIWYAAKRTWQVREQAKQSPFRWLSRIHAAGASFVGRELWEYRVALPSSPSQL